MSVSKKRSRQRDSASDAQGVLEALESRVFLSAVPSPLTDTAVGNPTGGSASYDSTAAEFTITGAGYDIYGAADGFRYVYQPLTGDGKVIVRVDSDSANNAKSLAGLTIRASLDPTAANLWVATRDSGQVFVDDRTADGAIGTNVVTPRPATNLPTYLEIQRSGNAVTASKSSDGVNFTPLITDNITLPTTVLVGMAVSSQTAPTTLATATFGAFQVIPASATPTATLSNAPAISGPLSQPYQFTVTYADATAIQASTISGSNITVTGPGGYSQQATLVSTGLTNSGSVAAVYSVTGLTTSGQYAVNLGANQVSNTSNQFVAGGDLGNFAFGADSVAPTAQVTSAPAITSSSTAPYTFQVAYSDNAAIDASTIKTGNIVVTGPGGYSQVATLVSTGLTSGPNVAASYSINPLPTTPGTYTITELPNQVGDTSGNAIAGGTVLGTFVVNGPDATTGAIVGEVINSDGRILKGATVFLDLNNDGIEQSTEPTAVSDGTATYGFPTVAPGTYSVVEILPAGQQILEPASGKQSVTVVAGQTATGPTFVDIPTDTAGATADLTAVFAAAPATPVALRAASSVSLTITNNGTGSVNKRIRIALLASTDGTIAKKIDAIRFQQVLVNLAAGASKTYTLTFRYPDSIPAGTFKIVAVLDPDGVVPELSKLNNSAVSSPVVYG